MSSAILKELPVAAKDINMARLSAPANKTPKTDRKSNRFREVFRHRASSSASASPATLTKSAPSADPSPFPTPIVRPGFHQIGLLPSEHSSQSLQRPDDNEAGHEGKTGSVVAGSLAQLESEEYKNAEAFLKRASATRDACHGLNSGGTRPNDLDASTMARLRAANQVKKRDFPAHLIKTESLILSGDAHAPVELKAENQVKKKGSFVQSMKSALAKHSVEKAGHDVAAGAVAMGEDLSPQYMDGEDKRGSLPWGSSSKIAEAVYNENISSSTDDGIDGYESFLIPAHVSDPIENSGTAEDVNLTHCNSLNIKRPPRFSEDYRMSEQIPGPTETAVEHEMDTTSLDRDAHNSGRKSCASNIFDNDSSFGQGIREYVASKIAETLAEHDRLHVSNSDATVNSTLHFTIKVDATGLARAKAVTGLGTCDGKTETFKGPSSIGPLKITSALLSRDTQLVVMALYAAVLLAASISGPSSLLLTVWRMAIVLGMYTAVLRQLDWTENVECDVFLVPVFFTSSVAKGMGEQLLDHMRGAVVGMFAEVLQRIAQGAGVQMRVE